MTSDLEKAKHLIGADELNSLLNLVEEISIGELLQALALITMDKHRSDSFKSTDAEVIVDIAQTVFESGKKIDELEYDIDEEDRLNVERGEW